MKFTLREFFYTSNLLSLSRIFIMYPMWFFYSRYSETGNNNDYYIVIALVLIGGFTDFLDGYLARKWNQISELGKILDPLCDKIGLAIMSIIMYLYADFPIWVIIIMLGRDLLIVIGASFIMNKLDEVPSSEMPGKIASTVISLLFLAYVAEWDSMKSILIIASVTSIAYSFLDYVFKFVKILQKDSK